MDTDVNASEKTILLKLADKLVEAQQEVDQLTLQLVLGKAEARDKYEELKNEFRTRLINFKNTISNKQPGDLYKEIISRIDLLEEKLKSGVAENQATFAVQRKYILKALVSFEKEFRKKLFDNLDEQRISDEIEKFKLKLEILRLRYVLKRFTLRDEIKSNVQEVRKRVSGIVEKARKKIKTGERKVTQLNKNISRVFS
jgi:hypothetical protein